MLGYGAGGGDWRGARCGLVWVVLLFSHQNMSTIVNCLFASHTLHPAASSFSWRMINKSTGKQAGMIYHRLGLVG